MGDLRSELRQAIAEWLLGLAVRMAPTTPEGVALIRSVHLYFSGAHVRAVRDAANRKPPAGPHAPEEP